METRGARKPTPSIEDAVGEVALRGLVNLGCTCYINCVLQVLVHVPAIAEFCLDDSAMSSRRCTAENCLVCQLGCIVRELRSTNRSPLAVPTLLRALWSIEPEFADGGMHDAHDFWLLVINALTHHPGGKKLMETLFKGELQTTLRCEVCGYTSRIVETIVDHSLSLQSTPPAPIVKDDASSCRDDSSNASSTPEEETSFPTASLTQTQLQGDVTEPSERPRSPRQRIRKQALRRCGSCSSCQNPKRKKGCLRNKVIA